MSSATLGWRPSRRLSDRAMWALWLVCLATIIGALALQHLSTLQVHGISSIQAAAVVVFLWLTLAWLWPDRSRRDLMLAVTAGLAFVVAARHPPRPGPRPPRRGAGGRGHGRAGGGDAGALPLADRRRQPHAAPAGRPRRPVRGQPGRRGRGGADGTGAGTLGDQPRVRPAVVGRPGHRLRLRRQRLPDDPGHPQPALGGHPHPPARPLPHPRGDRPVPGPRPGLRRVPADLAGPAPRDLGRHAARALGLGGVQPRRHARGRGGPGRPGGERLPAHHRPRRSCWCSTA